MTNLHIIDLKTFALTGCFGNIRIGMHQHDVIRILGEPNSSADFGTGFFGINYDGYELFFYSDTKKLSGIQNDNLSLHDRLVLFENRHFKIEPWFIQLYKANTYNEVISKLKKQHIRISQTTETEDWQVLRFDSGVRLLFSSAEQGGVLHAISYQPDFDDGLNIPMWQNAMPTIHTLESAEQFETVYPLYQALVTSEEDVFLDFDLWKYYFFFLWYVSQGFIEKLSFSHTLQQQLVATLAYGDTHYTQTADFYFWSGYCMHMLPYLFGEHERYEFEGINRLTRATQLEPKHPLYQMIAMGQTTNMSPQEYKNACHASNTFINIHYQGDGILNEYIRDVMYRKNT